MKQIIVTIALPQFEESLEVQDLLSCVNHSPEWLGAAGDWEIRSIHVHKDKHDKSQITALLENPNWMAPEVKAMTGNELYEAIKQYPDVKVKIATVSGINESLSTCIDSKYGGNSFKSGKNVLIFGGKDEIRVNQLLEEIGHKPEPVEGMDFSLWKMGEETRKGVAAMPIAIQIDEMSEIAYPLTGVRYVDNELMLIYNQDVEI